MSLRWKLRLLYVIVLSRVPRAPLFTQGLLRHTVGLFFSLLVPARRIGAPSSLSLWLGGGTATAYLQLADLCVHREGAGPHGSLGRSVCIHSSVAPSMFSKTAFSGGGPGQLACEGARESAPVGQAAAGTERFNCKQGRLGLPSHRKINNSAMNEQLKALFLPLA